MRNTFTPLKEAWKKHMRIKKIEFFDFDYDTFISTLHENLKTYLASIEFHSDARIIGLCWVESYISCRDLVLEFVQDWSEMITIAIK